MHAHEGNLVSRQSFKRETFHYVVTVFFAYYITICGYIESLDRTGTVLCSLHHNREAWTNGLLSTRPIVFNLFKYFCKGVYCIFYFQPDGSASLVNFLVKVQCVTTCSIPYNCCEVVVSLMLH